MSKKRAVSLLLALALCLCLFPVSAFAAEDEFVIEDGVLTGYNGPGGNVTIPSGVTSIGENAFFGCKSLTSVTIPDSVTTIDWGAFADCTSLTGVTIPNSVISIGHQAFFGCTSLTSVVIPNSVTTIGFAAFEDCTGLTGVEVDPGNTSYAAVDGVLFNKAMAFLHTYPAGKRGDSYSIPNSVTGIGDFAFFGCTSLTSIVIPNSVTTIGWHAFEECISLNSVIIPDSVISIGESAFSDCTSLTGIEVDPGNTSYAAADGVLFNKAMTLLHIYPAGKRDNSYSIPDSVTRISSGAFSGCDSLISVDIPNGVTEIGSSAFWCCSRLTNITIPNSVAVIGHWAFSSCYCLTSIVIPNGVTEIDDRAFFECFRLISVTIPNSVTEIGNSAFNSCIGLTSVTISDSVTEIGNSAFYRCTNLTDVYYSGSEAQWKAIDIGSANEALTNATIHYNTVGSFGDVKTGDYYADAVSWAIEKGITNGTSANTFSPNNTCTHGQILTFLWRAKDEPKPTGTVSGTQYYAAAAQWAKEQGLTDSFSAEADCTRAMVVTYLWKLAGSPDVGTPAFTDVPANADYAKAVAWAVKEGITNGTSETTFSPDQTCTRGQIVTFLHRAYAN